MLQSRKQVICFRRPEMNDRTGGIKKRNEVDLNANKYEHKKSVDVRDAVEAENNRMRDEI